MEKVLKPLVVVVALAFLGGVMLATADQFFGGSKVRNLFGMSADALWSGDPARPKHTREVGDAGDGAGLDAGRSAAVDSAVVREPIFMPASKSAGALAIPRVSERLLGSPSADAGAATP